MRMVRDWAIVESSRSEKRFFTILDDGVRLKERCCTSGTTASEGTLQCR